MPETVKKVADGTVVMYDQENHQAWIQAEETIDVKNNV